MIRPKKAFLWSLALFLMAGCAATVPPAEKRDSGAATPSATAEEPAPSLEQEDRGLFYEGVSYLNRQGRPDAVQARRAFSSFVQLHPQSRLRGVAESFVRMIDERESLRETGRLERLLKERLQAERDRLRQENDQLKKTVRELTEKLKTETAALSQENEKLRKDLQKLKELEIELEKRDRMLR